MGFKSLITKIIVLSTLLVSFPVYAQEGEFLIIDNNSGLKESFESYNEAIHYYENAVDEYDNLLLYEDDKLIKMEYGVVEFDIDSKYIEYYSQIKKETDYLCASYGIDGAYLYTDEDKVYFKVSSDIGYIDIDNVVLIPFEELNVKPSIYHCDEQYLYHNIKTQLDYEFCSSSLKIDYIPDFLNNNTDYYSYDGHYFYDDFYTMIDDYNNDTYDNAVNEEPYYNYFQYLPYRSLTNYDYSVLEDYFYNVLGINGSLIRYNDINNDGAADEINRSALYNHINDFYAYQNIYGANALMLISAAINESSYGRSSSSFYNNNLYSLSAYDSIAQTDNNRYDSISSCIYSYAKYFVSNRFTNHKRLDYCGSFGGDKISGINGDYSLDHYYGERLASTYFDLDSALGDKDYNNYSIAIIDNSFNVYDDNDLLNYKYTINNDSLLSFVVLDESDNSYLIQLDDASNGDYLYDYEKCVGYIDKDDVYAIINPDKYNDVEYVDVTYDFNGGSLKGYESLTVKTKKGSVPAYLKPELSGYEFVGYESQFETVNDDVTYVAKYKQISDISIAYLFNKQEELYPSLDLKDAYINVKYEDGTNKKVAITSEMISYIDINSCDEQVVIVTYCGLTDEKTICIDDANFDQYDKLAQCIETGDYNSIKELNELSSSSFPLAMSTIRENDSELRSINNRNYVINDNTDNKYDVSISGLDLSLDDKSSFSFFKDTYYVLINDINLYNKEKIMNVASGYGFKEECGIDISFKFNFENIKLNGPIVVQLDIADKQNSNIYTVYHVDNNGDVVKCRTTHSNNYVQFIAYEEGDYLVLSKASINNYNIDDTVENLSYANVGFDNHKFNLNVLFITVLVLMCLIGVIIYYIVLNKKDLEWKDYKKSLQKADTVLEEKQKS